MDNEYPVKVYVKLIDGSELEFLASETYDALGDGRLLVWSGAVMNHKEISYFSIPVYVIKTVMEQEDE